MAWMSPSSAFPSTWPRPIVPGTRLGPRAVRAASASLAWCRPYAWDFDPFDRLNVIDWGDVFFDSGSPQLAPEAIRNAYGQFVAAGVTPLTLGGDHFISFPILQALHEKHGTLSLIHFDAHCDTWRDSDGRIDHGTMFFHAARLGIVDPARSIQVGMRTHNDETHGYQVLDARWLHQHGVEACIAAIRERVGDGKCYISFDIDFLDPAHAPGTGTPVVGGFDTHTALAPGARPGRPGYRGHGCGRGLAAIRCQRADLAGRGLHRAGIALRAREPLPRSQLIARQGLEGPRSAARINPSACRQNNSPACPPSASIRTGCRAGPD